VGVSTSPVISSRQNPRFKRALGLREARERRSQGRFLVDGAREIGRALDAGLAMVEAWLAPDRLSDEASRALLLRLHAARVELIETTPELLARLAYGERDEGLVAVVEAPPMDLERLTLPPDALVGVVEGVEKPGNLGALLRSADGAGVDAVIVADPISDTWNPNAIRASLGTIFRLPLAVASAAEAMAFLRGKGMAIVAARVDASADYDSVDLSGPVALIVGSEDAGLGPNWSGPDVTAVRIPMLGVADSLNVSASAAVLFYEARRQRRVLARG
jgi:TrmH family RNA methyltransferase